jgi:hypothetical protein
MHSAVVATRVTLLCCPPPLLDSLAGWWSHIVIDVFAFRRLLRRAVLYRSRTRLRQARRNTPWFLALNYAVLAVILWLVLTRRRSKHLP